jgi:hypothetical protein
MAVEYEWKIEEVDDNGDILNCHFATRLGDFAEFEWAAQTDGAVRVDLCLVRDVWDTIDEDLVDRIHAYPDDAGKLTYHEEPTRHVPKRYREEYSAFNNGRRGT